MFQSLDPVECKGFRQPRIVRHFGNGQFLAAVDKRCDHKTYLIHQILLNEPGIDGRSADNGEAPDTEKRIEFVECRRQIDGRISCQNKGYPHLPQISDIFRTDASGRNNEHLIADTVWKLQRICAVSYTHLTLPTKA